MGNISQSADSSMDEAQFSKEQLYQRLKRDHFPDKLGGTKRLFFYKPKRNLPQKAEWKIPKKLKVDRVLLIKLMLHESSSMTHNRKVRGRSHEEYENIRIISQVLIFFSNFFLISTKNWGFFRNKNFLFGRFK